jgi:hypothetical protein
MDPTTTKTREILKLTNTRNALKLLRGPQAFRTGLPKALISEGPYRDSTREWPLSELPNLYIKRRHAIRHSRRFSNASRRESGLSRRWTNSHG